MQKENPKIKKKDMAKFIYDHLKQNNPEYIKKANGDFVTVDTIEKNIKKRYRLFYAIDFYK